MSAINLLILVLKIGMALRGHIVKRGQKKQMREAIRREVGEAADEMLEAADAARSGVDHSAEGMLADPDNRDNWPKG